MIAVTSDFLTVVMDVVDPAVAEAERNPPRLGADGQVDFDPVYHRAGRAVWASGIVGAPAREQAALFYALAQAGEGGHACPVVCTAGLVRALRTKASDELRERFLPPLLETDYDHAQRGAQFLTERQGGSDVGANRVQAVPDGNLWRLHGEKWFCSVADADQFVVTARPRGAPDGTLGIGCFLVPRDGGGFRIRRLKDKLGTRALATGEIEFEGAAAYPLGPLEDGFKTAVSVLNTSRWLNSVGSTGLMKRAFLEASGFAQERQAFGGAIDRFPLVRENLAVMKSEEAAAFASSTQLTELVGRIDDGSAAEEDVIWHRLLVNGNKFVTSLSATQVVRRAIETLGGNGTIEDFSPLPRLYRDAIVFESWEGTHNVLCAQVLRDLERFDAVDLAVQRAGASEDLAPRLRRSIAEPEFGALHFRRQLAELVRSLQVRGLRDSDPDAAELVNRRHLVPGWNPEADPGYAKLIDRVLAGDTESK
ncbi:MAG TPA: acyl-CoA dehydrogenase family protein [Gaiellaceae bacterium]|jgi:alkylation response protein AidB-like acyl-CoA dehydrogenase|nr:acyl-CoA dehydrogenase family protein [Gaiellaceae bacterium]